MTTDSALRELVDDVAYKLRVAADNPSAHGGQPGLIVVMSEQAGRLESILAAAASQQPAPAGMVLVPRELMGDMSDEGERELAFGNDFADAWKAAIAAAPAAQVAEPDGVMSYGVRRAVAEWEQCKSPLAAQHAMTAIANDLRNNPAAAPAVAVDEAGESWMTDELVESAPRAKELAERLVAPGPKAASVSASETHEIADFIFDTVAALEAAALKGDA